MTFDYDRDGDLDVFIVNNADSPTLFRNDVPKGGYLRVRVLTKDGRDAIGARVTISPTAKGRQRTALVGVGTHFLGQSDVVTHVGLGSTTTAERIVVHWPSGPDSTITRVAGDRMVTIREP